MAKPFPENMYKTPIVEHTSAAKMAALAASSAKVTSRDTRQSMRRDTGDPLRADAGSQTQERTTTSAMSHLVLVSWCKRRAHIDACAASLRILKTSIVTI